MAQKTDGVQKPSVCNVAVVPDDNVSKISALTTVVGTFQTSVNALIGVSLKQNCRIDKIKKLQGDADIFGSNSNRSSDEDDTTSKSSFLLLARGKLAGGSKKRKKN